MPRKKAAPKKTTKTSPVASSTAPTMQMPQPSRGPSNLLLFLLIAVSFFAGYLFFKVQSLEQGVTKNEGAVYLSVDNLKKYAKDLGLDTNKFNTCLDKGEMAKAVEADMKSGNDLGVRGTPGFLINGRMVGGAFPFETFKELIDKELDGSAADSCDAYSDSLKEYCSTDGSQPINIVAQEVGAHTGPAKGPTTAKVTIVEYSDFECPFCQRALPTVKQILDTYPNDVQFYYRHMPLNNIHPKAQKAAEAAECAEAQGKFWEYHDKLFQASGV
jgi:protein-disulfide isomerase